MPYTSIVFTFVMYIDTLHSIRHTHLLYSPLSCTFINYTLYAIHIYCIHLCHVHLYITLYTPDTSIVFTFVMYMLTLHSIRHTQALDSPLSCTFIHYTLYAIHIYWIHLCHVHLYITLYTPYTSIGFTFVMYIYTLHSIRQTHLLYSLLSCIFIHYTLYVIHIYCIHLCHVHLYITLYTPDTSIVFTCVMYMLTLHSIRHTQALESPLSCTFIHYTLYAIHIYWIHLCHVHLYITLYTPYTSIGFTFVMYIYTLQSIRHTHLLDSPLSCTFIHYTLYARHIYCIHFCHVYLYITLYTSYTSIVFTFVMYIYTLHSIRQTHLLDSPLSCTFIHYTLYAIHIYWIHLCHVHLYITLYTPYTSIGFTFVMYIYTLHSIRHTHLLDSPLSCTFIHYTLYVIHIYCIPLCHVHLYITLYTPYTSIVFTFVMYIYKLHSIRHTHLLYSPLSCTFIHYTLYARHIYCIHFCHVYLYITLYTSYTSIVFTFVMYIYTLHSIRQTHLLYSPLSCTC